jgi:glycosyltransferase involved in cell wall biosynthesis
VLAPDTDTLRAGLDRLLGDDDLRARMSAAAQAHASRYTWEATARGTLEVLAGASIARRGRRDGR